MHTLSGVLMMAMDSKVSVSLPAQLSYPMTISHLKMFTHLKTHINNLIKPSSNKMDISRLQEVLLRLLARHKVFLAAQDPVSLMDHLPMEALLEQILCPDNHHLIRMPYLPILHLFAQV
jgi:hypothetical protein